MEYLVFSWSAWFILAALVLTTPVVAFSIQFLRTERKPSVKSWRQCPYCGSHLVRRSRRRSVWERLLSATYIYPFRCEDCNYRYKTLSSGR
jgi:hypothetical protein